MAIALDPNALVTIPLGDGADAPVLVTRHMTVRQVLAYDTLLEKQRDETTIVEQCREHLDLLRPLFVELRHAGLSHDNADALLDVLTPLELIGLPVSVYVASQLSETDAKKLSSPPSS